MFDTAHRLFSRGIDEHRVFCAHPTRRRFVATWMSDAIGRRRSGMVIGFWAALTLAGGGYTHDMWVGSRTATHAINEVP